MFVHEPDLVVICIGTNDCNTGRKPEDYRADLEALVAAVEAAGSRVMLVRPSPFDAANPEEYAYGRTAFEAPAAGDYELRIGGSPTPQIVWVNGVNVWEGRRNNGYHSNADRVTVRMNAGRNEILVASNFMMFLGVHRK